MKSFVSTFFIILIICGIVTFFFASLILSNIWYATILIALIISIVVTVFAGQCFLQVLFAESCKLKIQNVALWKIHSFAS